MGVNRAAIVVAAYNRPESTSRLLNSLLRGNYPSDSEIPLVISVDGGGALGAEVQLIANRFEWPFGPKQTIFHSANLGLVDHIFSCGDLTEIYDRIILLEDDCIVGRSFYLFATQALDAAEHEPQIAGVSLSALWFHGFTQLPFIPYLDAGDNFYMQVAWYQGQAYTAQKWQSFREWCQSADWAVTPGDGMHPMFSKFPKTDWFPFKTKYLAQTNRFYLFPRQSLTLNFGDIGTHFSKKTLFSQVPLQEHKERWNLVSLNNSLAVYDAWQEMVPDRLQRIAPELAGVDFVCDFYGQRDSERVNAEFLLTTQPSTKVEMGWGLTMRPPEANLAHQIKGAGICLTKPSNIDHSLFSSVKREWERHRYFKQFEGDSGRHQTLFLMKNLFKKLL